jgi:hypothetical protein
MMNLENKINLKWEVSAANNTIPNMKGRARLITNTPKETLKAKIFQITKIKRELISINFTKK